MESMEALFGSNVFNDAVMQQHLPKDIYKALKKTIDDGRHLDPAIAGAVAHAMKEWAIGKGVTHYTHWFQPLSGITAEKHEAFITPVEGGRVIESFSGSELVRGESDASSFPSGGLRSTFEARGYTAWDPTSYAFIKDGVLCIPTAFCSYGSEALDKKTPLLRSMEALSRQAVRVLKLFGREVRRVIPTVGPEQEYFLVDKQAWMRRKDLIFTGRTLFGARPPKGQELDDHYYGAIKPRVQAFMTELDRELWKLGILAKTEHNEVAPAQHEMAPVYTIVNLAADHNQLTMEMMKKIADRHGLVCLLAEKPFAGVNGSGKHNNWSMTANGDNLLEPGDSPYDSAQFLLFLVAVIKAVDEHQDLLRVSVASAGNDHRLGANEAPPAIISMFLGDELTAILQAIETGAAYEGHEVQEMAIGVHVLPKFPKDNTDRNRTSPFAFTGNKFEFRSLGASASIADCNVVINTSVAESLRQYADVLEMADDFNTALHDLIVREIRAHKRIIFNGNGYSAAWVQEAKQRGLLNLPTAVDAIPSLIAPENVALFERHRVLSEAELRARYEIQLEAYCKETGIEAETMLSMARREILPAVLKAVGDMARSAKAVKDYSPVFSTLPQEKLLARMTLGAGRLSDGIDSLNSAVISIPQAADALCKARYMRDTVLPAMETLRAAADELETVMDAHDWPFPTYAELLFNV